MRYVVDTNVPVVANGTDTNASASCRLSCIDFLEGMISRGILVVDLAGEVEKEYQRRLSVGQPGVGNRFLQAFLTTAAAKRLERIELSMNKGGGFADFPASPELRRFDLSDRKFAALSKKSGAPVANAVDSDWLEHIKALEHHGVKVEFLCSQEKAKWFAPSG